MRNNSPSFAYHAHPDNNPRWKNARQAAVETVACPTRALPKTQFTKVVNTAQTQRQRT